LDAAIGCYLMLAGSDGMTLIEDLFLKKPDAEYADTYAVIMALRFHGPETTAIPRDRILQGFRYMLDRPQLADLVIPDLARWEDWSQVERLVKLFKEADDKSSWVRVPVINYLRACPKPEAKVHIAELEKLDPEAVKRANTFFPFGGSNPSPAEETKVASKEPAAPQGKQAESPAVNVEPASPEGKSDDASPAEPLVATDLPVAALPASKGPNLFLVIGVMAAVGLGLLGVQWLVLVGPRRSRPERQGPGPGF
jgi:hypothetical protein